MQSWQPASSLPWVPAPRGGDAGAFCPKGRLVKGAERGFLFSFFLMKLLPAPMQVERLGRLDFSREMGAFHCHSERSCLVEGCTDQTLRSGPQMVAPTAPRCQHGS